jgi:hypothetical protein
MALQYNTAHRTAVVTDINNQFSAPCNIRIWNGTIPVNCGTADTGTLLATLTGGTPFGSISSGLLISNAITSATAVATGTANYFRIHPPSATSTNAVMQGLVFSSVTLSTSSTVIANSNVLNFTSGATVFLPGMLLTGTGIAPNTYVLASTATTVTMSQPSFTGGSGGSQPITGGGDMTLTSTSISTGQTVQINSGQFTITASGA